MNGIATTNHGASIDTSVYKFGGGSLHETATAQYIELGDIDLSSGPWGIAAWVNISSWSGDYPNIMRGGTDISGTDRWVFDMANGTSSFVRYIDVSNTHVFLSNSVNITSNQPHYVVITSDAVTNTTMYLDGTLIGSFPVINPQHFTSNAIGRASASNTGQNYWIDDVLITKTAINGSIVPTREFIDNPHSNFTTDVTSGYDPQTIQITDDTLGNTPTSYSYRLTNVTGNNTELDPFSTTASPSVVLGVGNWSINQTVINTFGASSAYAFVNISAIPAPLASFTQNKTFGLFPLAIAFTDTSSYIPNIWVWTVNGTEIQNSSTIKDFTYTFYPIGTHQVNLTVWNTTLGTTPSTASQDIFVSSTTYSDFTISNDHPFIFNETVTFTPIGPLVANRYLWNFGDGSTFLDTNGTAVTHVYATSSANATLSASLTAYIVENTSITNTTSHTISPILFPSYVEASFIGSPTSGSVGVNVMFTDTSKFGTSNADSGRTYNWSFGDVGYSATPYSSVVGDVSHVYTNLGTYTVTLTVNNTLNSSSYSITNFITVSNQQNYAVTYPPKDVRFHIQTLYGQAISNALVQANPRQTSTGSYSYTASLFGYQLGVVPLNNLTLSGYTDSRGDITLAMMADVQYELGFSATGYTFDNQTITPHDDNYIIMPRGTGGSPFVTNGSSPQTNVLFTATYTRYNETAALLHINYTDYSLLTTGGDISLYRPNTSLGYTFNNVSEQENFVSVHFTGPNTTQGYILIDGATPACPSSSSAIFTDTYTLVACTNQTLVNDKSYFAAATGMTPGGNVSVQAPVWFKNIHTPIAGLSAEFALFAALGIMMFTAMMATPTTAPAISIAFAFEGWIFYGMNMLQLIDSPTQSGASVVVEVLIVITGIAIVYNFVEYRRRGK